MPPNRRELRLIGLDLDNTVIDYSGAYRSLARQFGLPADHVDRPTVRAALRRGPGDDEEWQRFQSLLYTDGLDVARPAAGVVDLLETCKSLEIGVFIASHKSPTGPERFGSRDLRTPARVWLRRHGIDPGLVGEVMFCDTLDAKVEAIAAAAPQVFIDDLAVVLAHTGFPSGVQAILYSADAQWVESEGVWSAGFRQITEWVTAC